MKTEIKLTPEQLAEFSSRKERHQERHNALAAATVKALRDAGTERLRQDSQPGHSKLKVPELAHK